MYAEVIIQIDGRTVATLNQEIQGTAFEREHQIECVQQRVGCVIAEKELQQIADSVAPPKCCGRPMKNSAPRKSMSRQCSERCISRDGDIAAEFVSEACSPQTKRSVLPVIE
jgi:hypothetical protein